MDFALIEKEVFKRDMNKIFLIEATQQPIEHKKNKGQE